MPWKLQLLHPIQEEACPAALPALVLLTLNKRHIVNNTKYQNKAVSKLAFDFLV